MKHPERVEDYLEHIVEAIDQATAYLRDTPDFATFEQDRRTRDAVVRNLEIVGEAATQLRAMDPDYPVRHPGLPWIEMRGMRNKITHGYFDVDWRVVWDTVRRDLAPLKQSIEALLNASREAE